MKRKTAIAILSCLCLGCVALGTACGNGSLQGGKELPPYNESGFSGGGINGVSGILDTVGYGVLANYEYFDDGAVALKNNFYAPLKNSRTSDGFTASLKIERRDGVFDVMTEAANTGALYVLCEDGADDIYVRHRIYVLGVDEETSYIVVSGAEKHVWDSGYDYYERRYLIPLGGYCTGAPLDMQVTYYQNAYYVTITAENGESYFKKIDQNTEFIENANYGSDMRIFFDNVERVLGLESLNTKAKFSDISFALGNEAAKATAITEKRTVSCVNDNVAGGSITVSEANPERGENVVVSLKPNAGYYLDSFTVDGKNRKYRLNRAENDTYEYEIVGVQKNCTVEAKYLAGEEQTYKVTGKYEYTSGVWNAARNRYENTEDVVSITAGIYQGEANDGEFNIFLPKGYFEISANSQKFPSARKSLTVEGETEAEPIIFDRLHYKTGVSYNADGSFEMSPKSVRLFDEKETSEGFVVNYTVKGGDGSWFNTGGLYIYDEENLTYDYIFVFTSGSKAQLVFIDADKLWSNGPTLNTSYTYSSLKEEIDVTIIYYQEQFHIVLGGAYACTVKADTKLTDTDRGTLGEDFFGQKARQLGLRTFDSSAVFSNVSYGIGDAAAIEAMRQLDVTVSAEASQGGAIALYNRAYSAIALQSTQSLGERITAEIIPEDGKKISEFTVNGKDKQYLLSGAFDRNGKYVYKYVGSAVKDGLNISVKFANEDDTQTVTGTYSYADGAEGTNITLKAGNIVGTAKDGAFSINLPDGTHVLTLTDENGRQATKFVTVRGEDVQVEEMFFRTPKFADGAKVSKVDNGYLVKSGYQPLDSVIASEGFVLEYTVQATESDMWFNGGATYFKINDVYYTIVILPGTAAEREGGNVVIGVQQSDRGALQVGYLYTNTPYEKCTDELRVKIVYYNSAFYFTFGDSTDAYIISQNSFTNRNFYTEGYREIGFRAWDTSATFTDISYKLGDEYAKEEVLGLETYTMTLTKGKIQMFDLDATTKSGEGFVAKYTAQKGKDWVSGGALVMKVGEYYYALGLAGNTVIVNYGTSLGVWNKTMKLGTISAIGDYASITVSIAYYNETFYIKADDGTNSGTFSFNASSSWSWNNHLSVCNANVKTLGICGTDCTMTYSGVRYEIGNDVAKAAVRGMGFTL